MRVRLYRFLLAYYGRGQWRPHESADASAAGRMTLVDRSVGAGQRPKTADRIRPTLKKLHCAIENQLEPGPFAEGIGDDAWILLTSDYGALCPLRTAQVLRRKGVDCCVVRRGRESSAEVRVKDFERASKLVDIHRASLVRRTASRSRIVITRRTARASRVAVMLTVVVLFALPLIAILCTLPAGFNMTLLIIGGGLLGLVAGICAAYLGSRPS